MAAYDKELIMYETVLPELRCALDEHGIRDELVARTIHVSWPRRALVFEDLAEQGFRMPVSSAGLDMEHAGRALHKLALFHAGCAYLRERDATVFERHFKHGECELGGLEGVDAESDGIRNLVRHTHARARNACFADVRG